MMCVQTVLYIVIMLMGAQPIGNAIGQIVGVIVVNGWMACNVSSYSKKEAEGGAGEDAKEGGEVQIADIRIPPCTNF